MSYQNGAYKYDFSTDSSQVYGGTASCKMLSPNVWGIPAGDVNGDGTIDIGDKNLWGNNAGNAVYAPEDINLDAQINHLDVNDFWILNYPFGCQVPE